MNDVVAPMFTEFIWLLGGGLIGLLLAIWLGVKTARSEPTPSVAWGAPLGVVVLSVVLAGVAGMMNSDLWTGAMAALLMRFLACLALPPVAAGWLLVLAVFAAKSRPRAMGVGGVVGGLAVLTAVLTGIEGAVGGNPVFGVARAVVYLAIGSLTAVGALGATTTGRKATAAQMASLVFPLLVGAIEGAERALIGLIAMRTASGLGTVEMRQEALHRMLTMVADERVYGMAALGVATLVPLVVFGVGQRATGDRRALIALLVLVIAWFALLVGLPDEPAMLAAIEYHRS